MPEKIEIELAAIDNASKVVTQIFDVMQSGAQGSALAVGVASVALAGLAAVAVDSVNTFLDYSETVKDFARNTGTSAEEASRLIQIGDDVRVSISGMETAFKMLSKKGIDPSIESIKKLSDEYLALAPGAERTQFLIDNFGRSGMEMGKLLERGSAGIEKLSTGISANLIVTDAAIKKAEEYKVAQDNLNDAWEGSKMAIGQDLLPALTQILTGMNYAMQGQEDYNRRLQETIKLYGDHGDKANNMRILLMKEREETIASKDAVNAHADALDGAIPSVEDYGQSAEETAAQVKELTKANSDLLSLTMSLQSENDKYSDSMADAIQKQSDMAAALLDVQTNWRSTPEQIQAATDKYDEAGVAIEELKQKHADAMASIAYDLFVAKLKADGFSDAEYQMALDAGVAMGQIDAATANTAKQLNDLANSAPSAEVFAAGAAGILSTADAVIKQSESVDTAKQKVDNLNSSFADKSKVDEYGAAVVLAGTTGTTAISETQNALDNYSTEVARDQIGLYIDELNKIPDSVEVEIKQKYTSTGTNNTGGGTKQKSASTGTETFDTSGTNVFNIYGGTMIFGADASEGMTR